MQINWYKEKKYHRPLMEDLQDGEEYRIELETDSEIYFTNWAERYSYYYKKDEGKDYKIIKEGKRIKTLDETTIS